jgi:hypothetical protein
MPLMQISTPHPRRLPTEEEVEHCLSVVQDLDEGILQIRESIEDLQIQLKALEDTRRNHLSFVTPIRCLPPELISEICKTCVEMGVSPLVLNQVCGRFRDIINDTSEFWSRIHVTDGKEVPYRLGYKNWDNEKVRVYHLYHE